MAEKERPKDGILSSSERMEVNRLVSNLMVRTSLVDTKNMYRKFLDKAVSAFERDKIVMHVGSDKTIIMSDLHGNIDTFRRVLKRYPPEEYTYILIGDYIDRGKNSLELMALLMGEKLLHPDTFIMTRGDHETRLGPRHSSFPIDLFFQLADPSMEEKIYGKLFPALPMAATLNGKYYLAHGGIPIAPGALKRLEGEQKVDDTNSNQDMHDTLWGDPHAEWTDPDMKDIKFTKGVHESIRGEGISDFGADTLHRFLEENGLKMFIRGHMHKYSGMAMGEELMNVSSPELIKIERLGSGKKRRFERMELISMKDADGIPLFKTPKKVEIAE